MKEIIIDVILVMLIMAFSICGFRLMVDALILETDNRVELIYKDGAFTEAIK